MDSLKLRILPVAFSLLTLAVLLPSAGAATTCAGETPRACIGTGPCYGAWATTGATDFYPGAAFCKTPAQDGAWLCGRAYAGIGTLGGFVGPNASFCVLGDNDPLVLCAGALGWVIDPVCL